MFSFATYFVYTNFYLKNESQNSSEVLAVAAPRTPQKIGKYIHENNIREECASEQPFFNTSCDSIVNKGQTVNMPEKLYYVNPVLEELQGEPVIFYYGGVYQIKRSTSQDSSVSLISRLYNTSNNRYSGACVTGYSPSSVMKFNNNTILWGTGGIQPNISNKCMNDQAGYTTTECTDHSNNYGIPRITKYTSGPLTGNPCVIRDRNYCYDKNFDCQMLNGQSQYWNTSHVYRVNFNKDSSGNLKMTLNKAINPTIHEGFGTEDANVYCFGKKRDGSCTTGLIMVDLRYQNLGLRIRPVDIQIFDSLKGWIPEPNVFDYTKIENFSPNVYLRDGWKTFYSRTYFGYSREKQYARLPDSVFAGLETPLDSYNLTERVDYLQITDNPADANNNIFDKRKLSLPTGVTGSPKGLPFESQPKTNFNPNYYSNNTLSDFSTDKYFFTIRYDSRFLYVTRYKPTGYTQNKVTYMNSVSLPVSLTYVNSSTRPNVTFGITSNNDLDILIAPQFTQMLQNNSVTSRVFRAEKFNAPINEPVGKLTELTNLNVNPDGYKFDNPGPGNNNPISMRYYKTDDLDPTNDYAVFASKNYVFTSLIPSSVKCSINAPFSLNNTHPSSVNFGIVPKNIANTSTFDLNFGFASVPTFICDGRNVPIVAGTTFTLRLYDGIDSSTLLGTYSSAVQNDLKSVNFSNISNKNYSKFFYTININFNGTEYLLNSDAKFFTLENFVTFNTFNDEVSPTPFGGAKLVVTKKRLAVETQYDLAQLNSNISNFSINSPQFNNFYFDHNLKVSSGTLVDDFSYKICYVNTVEKINKIGFTSNNTSTTQVSNSFLTATIQGNCIELFYKNPNITSYNMSPQQLYVFVQKKSGPITAGYKNFRVNGHIMIKNTPDIKMQINTDSEKNLQGIYVSSVDKTEKYQRLIKTTLDSNYKIPYYSDLTSSYNFQVSSDLVNFVPQNSNTNFLYHLLTDKKPNLDPQNFDEIDAYSILNTSQPRIIYLAKNKRIVFNLTNTNIVKQISNIYFVSSDSRNSDERILFKIDCNNSSYSLICINNRIVHIKGGLYGDIKLSGNLNTNIENKDFIVINQNPEILVLVQKDLRGNKIFNVTRSKTIFKYLD